MISLKVFKQEQELMVESREVAKMIGKRHCDLLGIIRGYEKCLLNGKFRLVDFFVPCTYRDSTGRMLPCFLITRKGCDMVANKMIGEKGVQFTATYITNFEVMEKSLSELKPKQNNLDETKRLRAEAMNLNAKTRQAKVMKDLALQFKDKLSVESIHLLVNGITELLIGKSLLPIPILENTYQHRLLKIANATSSNTHFDDDDIPF